MIVLTAVIQAFMVVVLVAGALLTVRLGRDLLTVPYPEVRDCACGPGVHHSSCPLRLTVHT